MPLDWENRVIVKKPNTKTRFCSVNIDDPSSCHKVSSFFTFLSFSFLENITKVVALFLSVNQ